MNVLILSSSQFRFSDPLYTPDVPFDEKGFEAFRKTSLVRYTTNFPRSKKIHERDATELPDDGKSAFWSAIKTSNYFHYTLFEALEKSDFSVNGLLGKWSMHLDQESDELIATVDYPIEPGVTITTRHTYQLLKSPSPMLSSFSAEFNIDQLDDRLIDKIQSLRASLTKQLSQNYKRIELDYDKSSTTLITDVDMQDYRAHLEYLAEFRNITLTVGVAAMAVLSFIGAPMVAFGFLGASFAVFASTFFQAYKPSATTIMGGPRDNQTVTTHHALDDTNEPVLIQKAELGAESAHNHIEENDGPTSDRNAHL